MASVTHFLGLLCPSITDKNITLLTQVFACLNEITQVSGATLCTSETSLISYCDATLYLSEISLFSGATLCISHALMKSACLVLPSGILHASYTSIYICL